MEKDLLSMRGRFMLYEDNVLLIDTPNLVTTIGTEVWAKMLSGDLTDVPSYLSVDGADIVYDESSSVCNEILLKEVVTKSTEDNKLSYEFLITGDEAVAQFYGFGLTNVPGAVTNFGKVNTNLVNQSYNHQQDKYVKIKWILEVVA
jgi:hypothetical protein